MARNQIAETKHRISQASRLRQLFSRDRWYTNVELQRLAGAQRFGARILELRRGDDGGPPLDIHVERVSEAGSRYRYRCFGALKEPRVLHPASLVSQLRAELKAYRARLKEHGIPLPRRARGGR